MQIQPTITIVVELLTVRSVHWGVHKVQFCTLPLFAGSITGVWLSSQARCSGWLHNETVSPHGLWQLYWGVTWDISCTINIHGCNICPCGKSGSQCYTSQLGVNVCHLSEFSSALPTMDIEHTTWTWVPKKVTHGNPWVQSVHVESHTRIGFVWTHTGCVGVLCGSIRKCNSKA